MRSHSPPITSTGVVTAAKSTTVAFESFATATAISHIARPDSQTKPSYISRAVSSVWVLAIHRRNCSNVGGYTGLAHGRGRRKYGRDMRKFVGAYRRCPPPSRDMLPPTQRGVGARRPTAPAARPSSDLPEAVGNPANSRTPPSRRCSPEGLVTQPSLHLPAWVIRGTAASGCAPCIHAV